MFGIKIPATKLGMILATLMLTSFGISKPFGQPGSLLQPPPPIDFADWKDEAPSQKKVLFPSAIATGYPANDLVPVSFFLPEGEGPHPVVIILHYWGAADQRVEISQARRMRDRGIATALIQLPYHLDRAPLGTRSGELAIQPNPMLMKQTMAQSVSDIRRTIDFIQRRPEFDSSRIGIAGTSLGGVIGALAYAVDERVAAFGGLLAGANLTEIIWGSSRLVRERDTLRKRGWTKESLAVELAEIEPSTYLPNRKKGSVYLVCARYDTVVPRRTQEELIKATGTSKVLWMQTGHYGGFLAQDSVLGSIASFFEQTFQGNEFQPPTRLFVPTLRLTGTLNPGTGLQVGVGIDLWRNNDAASLFGSLVLTPRGPEGFLGSKISTGLAIGVSIQTKRTVPGLLWSFVL